MEVIEHHEDSVENSLDEDLVIADDGNLTTHELGHEYPVIEDSSVSFQNPISDSVTSGNHEQSSSETVAYDMTPEPEENGESEDGDVPVVETLEDADGWEASPISSQQDHLLEDADDQLDFTFDHFGPDTSHALDLLESQHFELPETSTAVRDNVQEQRRTRRNRGVPRERLDL